MRRLRHRQFKPLLKTVLLAPSGSGTSAQVGVVFQAKAYNSTPGAGRPAAPVGSYLIFRPLLLLVEATKRLVGRSRNHLTSWVTVHRGNVSGLRSPAGWVRWGSAWLLSKVSSGPPDGTSGPRAAHRAQELPWLLLETEISQSCISEIFASCPQLSIFISLLILEMTTGHCSQTPQLSSPKQAMVSWSLALSPICSSSQLASCC